jgi:ATP-dependent DNA helicase RecG
MRDGFVTIIYRKQSVAYEKVSKESGEKNKENFPERSKKKVTERVTENGGKVTENQQMIVDCISQNAHITSDELAIIVGISPRKIKENISKLKTKGLLERIGPDKGGYWKVIRKIDKKD